MARRVPALADCRICALVQAALMPHGNATPGHHGCRVMGLLMRPIMAGVRRNGPEPAVSAQKYLAKNCSRSRQLSSALLTASHRSLSEVTRIAPAMLSKACTR